MGESVGSEIPALIASMQEAGLPNELILSAVQNYQRRGARQIRNRQGQPRRFATPPRDAKDLKCANCNASGHMAKDCPKPKILNDQKKCHLCGKTGHLARACPDKQKVKLAIEDAITSCGGNIPKAAALLGISASTIYRKRQHWESLDADADATAAD